MNKSKQIGWQLYNHKTDKVLGEFKTWEAADIAWCNAVKQNRFTKEHVDKNGFSALHLKGA